MRLPKRPRHNDRASRAPQVRSHAAVGKLIRARHSHHPIVYVKGITKMAVAAGDPAFLVRSQFVKTQRTRCFAD